MVDESQVVPGLVVADRGVDLFRHLLRIRVNVQARAIWVVRAVERGDRLHLQPVGGALPRVARDIVDEVRHRQDGWSVSKTWPSARHTGPTTGDRLAFNDGDLASGSNGDASPRRARRRPAPTTTTWSVLPWTVFMTACLGLMGYADRLVAAIARFVKMLWAPFARSVVVSCEGFFPCSGRSCVPSARGRRCR